jgi:hypothetical protein
VEKVVCGRIYKSDVEVMKVNTKDIQDRVLESQPPHARELCCTPGTFSILAREGITNRNDVHVLQLANGRNRFDGVRGSTRLGGYRCVRRWGIDILYCRYQTPFLSLKCELEQKLCGKETKVEEK